MVIRYTVWQNDNSSSSVDPECAPLVERAMKLWVTEKRDTWLSLQCPVGSELSMLASTITSSLLTTADQRRDATERDKANEDERLENRRLAGFLEAES